MTFCDQVQSALKSHGMCSTISAPSAELFCDLLLDCMDSDGERACREHAAAAATAATATNPAPHPRSPPSPHSPSPLLFSLTPPPLARSLCPHRRFQTTSSRATRP